MDRFERSISETDEGILFLASDGTVAYVNPAAEFLLDCRCEELVGELFGSTMPAEQSERVVNVVSADSSLRFIRLTIEPLPGHDGTIVRLRDVTRYHHDLDDAREQVRRRDEFLAMLGHELRNPLAAIKSAATLLGRDDLSAPDRGQANEVVVRQFAHLERILDDLLDIARISRGKLDLQRRDMDLAAAAGEAADAVRPLIAEKGHVLEEAVAGPLPVHGDRTRLAQVVINLLTNAARYTPPAGRIRLEVRPENGRAALRVIDNGSGVPSEMADRIFEPFVQGHQELDRSRGGLGIGLALVAKIVELHGGTVRTWRNSDGPGSTFEVSLPLLAGAGPASPAAERGRNGRPSRLLLVEDNPDGRTMLKALLESEGHQVSEAADGPAGLELLRAEGPDAALVDIGLPGFDGLELARLARADPKIDRVRLIALTGYGSPEDVRLAFQAGFDAHLTKPLNYDHLLRVLEDIVES